MTKVAKAQVARVAKRPRALVRAVVERARWVPLTVEDEQRLADEYDTARGYDRPRRGPERGTHEHAAGAPLVTWTPPGRRPRVL